MRLVAENGDQLGIQPVAEALRMAEEKNVDLVEIAPLANPPVCKLMDYGKFRYREQKKAHEAKLKQKQIQVKEIKFRPGTDEGDYKIKLGKLIQFLEEGDKAKVTLRFRGREMAHQELGTRLLDRLKEDVSPVAKVEMEPPRAMAIPLFRLGRGESLDSRSARTYLRTCSLSAGLMTPGRSRVVIRRTVPTGSCALCSTV